MSRGQAAFFIGFAIVVLWWAAGFWVALGGALAGAVAYAVSRITEGDVDLRPLAERLSGGSDG